MWVLLIFMKATAPIGGVSMAQVSGFHSPETCMVAAKWVFKQNDRGFIIDATCVEVK
jgi:hypothetical protein